jgi:hypothetical protein
VVAVTSERLSAHTEWREAQARAEILLADDSDLYAVVSDFETFRSTATAWARAYFQAGEAFDFSDHDENQRKAWEGMKAARRRLIAVAQRRAATDARRMLPLPRFPDGDHHHLLADVDPGGPLAKQRLVPGLFHRLLLSWGMRKR